MRLLRAGARAAIAAALLVVLPPLAAPSRAALADEMVSFPARLLLPHAIYDEPIDPAPLCLPAVLARRVARRAERLVAAPVDPDVARHWVALYDHSGGRDVLARFIAARAARTPAQIRQSTIALDELRGDVDRELRECATLESARILLFERRHADAAARAVQALALSRTPERRRAATFYRGEALALAGRGDEALPFLRALAGADDDADPIAAAARARIAALELAGDVAGDARAQAREALESSVLRARAIGLPVAAFGTRAVEAALRDGDEQGLREWIDALTSTRLPIEVGDWLRVLEADLEVAKGHVTTARAKYDAIAHAREGSPIGTLAALRSLRHADLRRGDREIEWLTRTAASAVPPLSGYAKLVLAQASIAAGEKEAALDLLSAAVFEHPRADIARPIGDLVTQLLVELVRADDGDTCSRSLELADWRRSLLVQASTRVEPFLALGRCYERFGLAAAAESLYREVLRRFGADVAPALALPLARTSLALGEVARARTVAAAQARAGGPQRAEWELLLGRSALAEGDAEAAIATLVPLVERREPEGEALLAIVELARALRPRGELGARGDLLANALLALTPAQRDESAALLALELAHARRALGRDGDARALYDLVLGTSARAGARAEALYWRDAGARDRTRAPALREIARAPETRPWSELARTTLDVFDLRARLRAGMPSVAEYFAEAGG
ncbi:MAG: hypothetical protein R3E88_18115 [Myxococcota bacterium]